MPLDIPDGFIPIFNFKNETERKITLALEMMPQEIELLPGDRAQVYVYEKDDNLPLDIELSENYIQIHPHTSLGNWYVFKNGEDVSGEPYRTPT